MSILTERNINHDILAHLTQRTREVREFDSDWFSPTPPLNSEQPTTSTPIPTEPRPSATPSPEPTEWPPAPGSKFTPIPATETPAVTETPTQVLNCIVTDLKGILNHDGSHFIRGLEITGYVENISDNPECPQNVKIWVYGSNQYPETPGWLESQKYLTTILNLNVPPHEIREIRLILERTPYEWCQVDFVRGEVEPLEPPEPPYLSGNKMIDYLFVNCGLEEFQETPAPEITLTPTGTPIPLPPTGNPPDENMDVYRLLGDASLYFGIGMGAYVALKGLLYRKRVKN